MLTNKWILAKRKKYRIPQIQSTELKKINRVKGPSEDVSVLLGREKKTITRWEGTWKGEGMGRRENMIRYWGREKD